MVEVLGGESKVSNSAKLRNTHDALTTFVLLGAKGLRYEQVQSSSR